MGCRNIRDKLPGFADAVGIERGDQTALYEGMGANSFNNRFLQTTAPALSSFQFHIVENSVPETLKSLIEEGNPLAPKRFVEPASCIELSQLPRGAILNQSIQTGYPFHILVVDDNNFSIPAQLNIQLYTGNLVFQ